jgi:hypothetical protein
VGQTANDIAPARRALVEIRATRGPIVDLPEPPRPFWHDLRLERAIPVVRHLDRDRTVGRGDRLAPAVVSRVARAGAGRIIAGVAELVGHLGLQGRSSTALVIWLSNPSTPSIGVPVVVASANNVSIIDGPGAPAIRRAASSL